MTIRSTEAAGFTHARSIIAAVSACELLALAVLGWLSPVMAIADLASSAHPRPVGLGPAGWAVVCAGCIAAATLLAMLAVAVARWGQLFADGADR